MNIMFFHWSIHGWIVYVVILLLLGWLCYRRGLPMTMITCFYPILGDKMFRSMGDLIDIFCITCTMFSVCTSLGLGVIQLNNMLHRLNTDISENSDVQTVIIWCITVVASISVISGIKVGIRRLSEICLELVVYYCLLYYLPMTNGSLKIFAVFYINWLLHKNFERLGIYIFRVYLSLSEGFISLWVSLIDKR